MKNERPARRRSGDIVPLPPDWCSRYHARRLTLAEELLLPKAESGEIWAIQNICMLSAEALADGCSLTPLIAQFVSGALRAIHDGTSGDTAFGIKRKPGESDRRRVRQRAYAIADFSERTRRLDDLTVEKSISITAHQFSVSEDTVRKDRKKHLKEVSR